MKFFEWIKETLFTMRRKAIVEIEIAGADEFERKIDELTERMATLAELCGTVRAEAERAADMIARLKLVADEGESQGAALSNPLEYINTSMQDITDKGL